MRRRLIRRDLLFALVLLAGVTALQSAPAASAEMLQQRLRKFPEADANGDGRLTEAEAREHQKALKRRKTRANAGTATAAGPLAPTRADVRYGPHERNVFDLWRAAVDQPTPVLVFFHGGSFKAGDKASVRDRPIFAEALAAGISVVSANYRYSTQAPFPAPMHDGARVVQFLRAHAVEWQIDPDRIAVSGSSAGATLALWIALHDDLGDPASADPILRFSTRVTCASPHSGTAGLEPAYFKRHAGVESLGKALYQLFGVSSRAEFESPATLRLVREASPIAHATRDDPPLFLTYAGDPAEAPFPADAPQGAWIHHVSLGAPLKARYDELGLACELYAKAQPIRAGAEIDFLRRHLRPGAPKRAP